MPDPDKFCLDCGYPLTASATSACPECGREFDPSDLSTVSINRGDLVKLYVGGNQLDVYLLRDMLADEGIPSAVMGEGLAAGRGELPMTPDTMPSLWVGQNDVEPAMQVAAEFDKIKKEGVPEGGDAKSPWKCPGCGEEVEGHFGTCWNCGADRPATPPPLPQR